MLHISRGCRIFASYIPNMDLKKLRDIRKMRGLTIGELAKKVGVNRDTISDIEKGKANPTYNNLESIADALNVTIEILL